MSSPLMKTYTVHIRHEILNVNFPSWLGIGAWNTGELVFMVSTPPRGISLITYKEGSSPI